MSREITLARKAHAARITVAWSKSVAGIIETSRYLIEAKADPKLPHGQFGLMFERGEVPFTRNTAERLMCIARNLALVNAAHVQHLPASWGTLYELSRLEPPEITRRIRNGQITADLERKDIRAWFQADVADRMQQVAFEAERIGKFPFIYADPAWKYENPPMGGGNRSIENQYPTMTLEEICALPVGDIAHEDCILHLWATAPKLSECMQVVEAWGFEYRTEMIWRKTNADGSLHIGMGYHCRGAHESLLICKRGELPPPEPANRPPSIIDAPVGEHSEKPEIFAELIERAYPPLQKIELFCRGAPRPGWSAWGNQAKTEAAAE